MIVESDAVKTTAVKQSLVTLANAAEVVVQLVTEIAGNDIADSINGAHITRDIICNIAQRRMLNNLTSQQEQ